MIHKTSIFRKAIFYLILIPFLAASCQNGADNVGEKFVTKAGEITITKAKGKHPRMIKSLTHRNSETNDLFATLPRKDSFIYVYSALNDTIQHQFPLNSVFASINSDYFNITGYYFKTLDSLFVATRNDSAFLINKHGSIVRTIPINDTIIDNKKLDFTTYGNHPYFHDNKFYLGCQYPNYSFSTDTTVRRVFFNTPLVSVIDAQTGKLIHTCLEYPAFYKSGEYYKSREPNRTVNARQNLLAYSFHYSDSIYVLNKDLEVNAYYASSMHFNHPDPFDGDSIRNRAYSKKYATVNGKFTDIFYDPYRELYYRTLKHPLQYQADKNTINTPLDAKFSIIVLNKEFKKIYEHVFEPGNYNYYSDIVITKKGLLIPLHHQNPNYKSGKWDYDLFKINQDEINS